MAKSFDEEVVHIRVPAPTVGVDVTNDGTLVAVALYANSGSPSVCVYDTATGELVAELAMADGRGRGVVFGQNGQCVYGLVEDPSGLTHEVRRYTFAQDGSDVLESFKATEGCYGLTRNRSADLIAVLGLDTWVFRNKTDAQFEVVRIIHGVDPSRRVHTELAADSPHAYCTFVAQDHVVRWDLVDNREDRRWPTPGVNGTVKVSRSGRYLVAKNGGIQGVHILDTETGEHFMPDDINEDSYAGWYAFAPDESGFVYSAGGKAGFREWSQKRFFGPRLSDSRLLDLHAARDADVYVYEYAENHLCVVRMS